MASGIKLTQEEAIAEMQKLEPNYDFSKFKYTRSIDKSVIICDKGHHFDMSHNSFKNGNRCKTCSEIKMSNKYKITNEEAIRRMKEQAPDYDFSEFIHKPKGKGKVKCPFGHIYDVSYHKFMKGRRCPKCSGIHRTTEEARDIMKRECPSYNFDNFIYIKGSVKSSITCDKGHEFEMSYRDFVNAKHRCPKCSGRHKTTEECIEEMSKLEPSYDFSKFEYLGSIEKSLVRCSKGHDLFVTFDNFIKLGRRCRHKDCCVPKPRKRNYELTEEEIKKKINSLVEDMKNEEEKYDFSKFNNHTKNTKAIFICDRGHEYFSTYYKFMKGRRCSHEICKKERLFAKLKEKENEVIKMMKESEPNYDFTYYEYMGADKPSKIICDKGHEFYASKSNFIGKSSRCSHCAKNKKITYEECIEKLNEVSKDRFTYDKNFIKKNVADTRINCKCLMCSHEWNSSYRSLVEDFSSCPSCNKHYRFSKPEFEIIEYIKSFYFGELQHGIRDIIDNPTGSSNKLEIDILLPELNLAFEYNGTYWHSDENISKRLNGYFKTACEYHQYKNDKCLEKGIHLIHIEEKDYVENKEKIFKMIKEEISKRK